MKAALFSAPSRRPAKVCAVTRGDRVATLEEANLHCQKSWSTCKAWATLARIMHYAALFCMSGARTRANVPSGENGGKQLVMQRVRG
jgi:hypothetical protein